MKKLLLTATALGLLAPAAFAETLVVSSWGGSFRDLIADTIAKKFTEETGVEVEFITGTNGFSGPVDGPGISALAAAIVARTGRRRIS